MQNDFPNAAPRSRLPGSHFDSAEILISLLQGCLFFIGTWLLAFGLKGIIS